MNEQEPEIEYVEDIDGLEEEDDIEDFGSFSIDKSLENNGKLFVVMCCKFYIHQGNSWCGFFMLLLSVMHV